MKINTEILDFFGWILPDGTFCPCKFHEHAKAAEIVFKNIGIESTNPEYDAEKMNWIKISSFGESQIFLFVRNPTQYQIDALFDWCLRYNIHFPELSDNEIMYYVN